MDIACDTEMVHKVPYVGPRTAYDLTSGKGHHGAWGLFVYSPLLYGTGSSSSAEVTVWASFEDVELMGQTYSAWIGQSGNGK